MTSCIRDPCCPRTIEEIQLDRKSTRLNSSHQIISYAVFCLKKKNKYALTAAFAILARQAAGGDATSHASSAWRFMTIGDRLMLPHRRLRKDAGVLCVRESA